MIVPALILVPSELPVSLDAAKLHMRIDHADDDALITALISAATSHLDGYGGILGKCLMRQKWRVSADRFCSQRIDLPFSEVVSVELKYVDGAAVEQTVASDNYELLHDTLGQYVYLSPAFPNTDLANTQDPAWVELTCGVENAAELPGSLVQAMLMMIAYNYENRTGEMTDSGLPMGVLQLLAPHRKWRL